MPLPRYVQGLESIRDNIEESIAQRILSDVQLSNFFRRSGLGIKNTFKAIEDYLRYDSYKAQAQNLYDFMPDLEDTYVTYFDGYKKYSSIGYIPQSYLFSSIENLQESLAIWDDPDDEWQIPDYYMKVRWSRITAKFISNSILYSGTVIKYSYFQTLNKRLKKKAKHA